MSRHPEVFEGVLIAGAGPSGMTAAVVLAQLGVPVKVLEARSELSRVSRASTFHPPTLEMLDTLGVVDDLLARGLRVERYQYRDRTRGVLAEFDLSLVADRTPFPFRLQCEQSKLTPLLVERLTATGIGAVEFDSGVAEVREGTESVQVRVVDQDGSSRWLAARMLIGADGANSSVRSSLRIPFEGMTYEEEFVVVTTDFAFEGLIDGLAQVSYIADEEEWLVLLRISDAWRVLFPRPAGERLDDEQTADLIAERLRVLCGDAASDASVLEWSRYHVHQRVAERFRVGRVLLAGDAAHVNSPIGGLGMNSGIHDAFLAGLRVADFITEGDERALDDYATSRHAFAHDTVQRLSHRNTRALQRGNREENREWMEGIIRAGSDPASAVAYMLESAMIDTSDALVAAVNARLTEAEVQADA